MDSKRLQSNKLESKPKIKIQNDRNYTNSKLKVKQIFRSDEPKNDHYLCELNVEENTDFEDYEERFEVIKKEKVNTNLFKKD